MPSPIAQSVADRTWEKELTGSIPGSVNILTQDWWQSLPQDLFPSRCFPLFWQWWYAKVASGLERILCRVLYWLMKSTGLWNWNTVVKGVKHHTINQHIILSPWCFRPAYFSGWFYVRIVWQRVRSFLNEKISVNLLQFDSICKRPY